MESCHFLLDRDDLIETILSSHDLLNRFEVGVCELKNSRFYKQRCARALYAHSRTDCTLYRTILCKPSQKIQDLEGVPRFLWLLLEKERVESLLKKDGNYSLFSIPFTQAMTTDTVSDCWNYKVTEKEQMDEKLGKRAPVYFAEIDLHTTWHDRNITVYKRRSWNSEHSFWYIFPRYFFNNGILTVLEDESCTADRVLPSHCFTGRFAALGFEADMELYIPKLFKIPIESTMECTLFVDDKELKGDRGTSTEFGREPVVVGEAGEPATSVVTGMRVFSVSIGKEVEEEIISDVSVDAFRSLEAPASVDLELDAVMERINAFVLDPEEYICTVDIPLRDPLGRNFTNRSKTIKQFREQLELMGLTMRKESASRLEGLSRYEVCKKSAWTGSELLDVVKELEVEELQPHLECLRGAVTRFCEDSNFNYEIMEIIGDAILDYVVVTDTFIVNNIFDYFIEKGVTSFLLCNAVISNLLPPTVEHHLHKIYGDKLERGGKVMADIFEAIIGAAYLSRIGLDNIRKLLYVRFRTLPKVEDTPAIEKARVSCPYLAVSLEDLQAFHAFRCVEVIDQPLREKVLPSGDGPKRNNSHKAAVGLPRVQAKQYATHFTTGPVYSYRRLQYFDSIALHNRIVSFYKMGEIAFVNETIQPRTHLVVDFDGADIQNFNVIHLFCEWYGEKFKCPAAMFVVDSTGLSVVTKKMKHSCHIHFPQITLDLNTLEQLQKDFRAHITKKMQQMFQSVESITENSERSLGFLPFENVLFYSRYHSRALSRRGWSPKRGLWDYCNAEDLLTVRKTCRLWRRSVDEHVAALSQKEPLSLAKLFSIPPENIFLGPDVGENVDGWVVLKVDGETYLLPDQWCSVYQHKGRSLGLRVKFHDGESDGNHIYDHQRWDTIIDSSLTVSRKLRLYLCDKYDTVYGEERRVLYLDKLVFPSPTGIVSRRIQTQRPDKRNAEKSQLLRRKADVVANLKKDVKKEEHETVLEDINYSLEEKIEVEELEAEAFPAVVAHSSALRLTSLRTPEFRDVSQNLYYGWSPNPPSYTEGAAYDTTPQAERSDRLPSFDQITSGQADPQYYISADDIGLWCSGLLLPPSGVEVTDKAKAMALLPSWWSYNSTTRESVYYIAGEKTIRIKNCQNLHDGIAEKGGLLQLVRLITPHIRFPVLNVQQEWCHAYQEELLPLFVGIRKKVDTKVSARPIVPKKVVELAPTTTAREELSFQRRLFPSANEPTQWEETLPQVLLSNPFASQPLLLHYTETEGAVRFGGYDNVFDLKYFSEAMKQTPAASPLHFDAVYIFNEPSDDDGCLHHCKSLLTELKHLCSIVYFSSSGVLSRLTEIPV
uniref:Dicer 1 n=1 Tax=Angomonas desouzai TaxID=59800 RepID=A0A1B2LUL7_9TRYP|nr:dicer 1 [Angomonas desouzai]